MLEFDERLAAGKQMLCSLLSLQEGWSPFPWQEELLKRFLVGDVCSVDVPTGLGKTAVMAIWLAARACGAPLPRRLVYVVDRRAVVDQATEEALRLREAVETNPLLKEQLGLRPDQTLPLSTLRGELVDNREWLADPAAPAIVVGTVDMIGSRLLFEGYGVSRKMRPYHAGLLGADTLVVLDESHLVPPFEHLLRAVETEAASRACAEAVRSCVPPFRLLTLSATGREKKDNVVRLTKRDEQHAVVGQRLRAKKSLRIERLDPETSLDEALAKHAWALSEEGKKPVRVLVYADSREIARKAKEAVERLAKGDRKQAIPQVEIETELFVGGRRVRERQEARDRLKNLGFLAGNSAQRSKPVFLFATSAGEVGVDLDADHMVCDLVAWERMVQRLGRVNRRGAGEAKVIVVDKLRADEKVQQALQKQQRGEELTAKELQALEEYQRSLCRLKAIQELRKNSDGTYDASPQALLELRTRAERDETVKQILAEATTPEPLRPALTRPVVESWAMTSLERHTGRPLIQPWLRGWVEEDPQTAVVWRRYLPVRSGGVAPSKREIEQFFEAAPPHTSEILETETFRVVEWLTGRMRNLRKQQVDAPAQTDDSQLRDEDVVGFCLNPDGTLRQSLKLRELDPTTSKNGKENLHKLLAGGILVVDARLAGLRHGLLDDVESAPPRTADDGQEWLSEGATGFRVCAVDAGAAIPKDQTWRERYRFAAAVSEDGEVTRWLVIHKWREDAATEEDRSAGYPQLLDEHQSWTEERARRLAKSLGLDGALTEILALAARLHDEGKRAARWQRAFHAPNDGIYAKTEGPIDYRLLDGYRHELGSLLRAEKDQRIQNLSAPDRDLVLHLIAAHHGFARPVIGISGCEDAPPSVLEEKASEIALRFARLQDQWGPWGLAWLEALLRAADQQASRENDARAGAKEGA